VVYHRSKGRMNWHESKNYCYRNSMVLAVIRSPTENANAKNACSSQTGPWKNGTEGCWLGLEDQGKEGHWKWVDGTLMNYKHWHGGEPNNYAGGEDCGHMWGPNKGRTHGTWNDNKCSNRNMYALCSKGFHCHSPCPPVCKMYCQYGKKRDARGCEICACNQKGCYNDEDCPLNEHCSWNGGKKHCEKGISLVNDLTNSCYTNVYTRGYKKMSWDDAAKWCESKDMKLASNIKDAKDNKRAWEECQRRNGKSCWIGLRDNHKVTDKAREYKWLAPAYKPMYFQWRKGQPNNIGGKQQCVEMAKWTKGDWNDSGCKIKRYPLCSKRTMCHNNRPGWTWPNGKQPVGCLHDDDCPHKEECVHNTCEKRVCDDDETDYDEAEPLPEQVPDNKQEQHDHKAEGGYSDHEQLDWKMFGISMSGLFCFLALVVAIYMCCRGRRTTTSVAPMAMRQAFFDAFKGILPMQHEGVPPNAPPLPETLPHGWKSAIDKQSGDCYYYHSDGRVQWVCPEDNNDHIIPDYLEGM